MSIANCISSSLHSQPGFSRCDKGRGNQGIVSLHYCQAEPPCCVLREESPIQITIERRPRPTADQIASWAQAQVSGKRVPQEIADERAAICAQCSQLKISPSGVKFCGLGCGCPINPEPNWILKTLTQVEENLPTWGCKHPRRWRGSGWKR